MSPDHLTHHACSHDRPTLRFFRLAPVSDHQLLLAPAYLLVPQYRWVREPKVDTAEEREIPDVACISVISRRIPMVYSGHHLSAQPKFDLASVPNKFLWNSNHQMRVAHAPAAVSNADGHGGRFPVLAIGGLSCGCGASFLLGRIAGATARRDSATITAILKSASKWCGV